MANILNTLTTIQTNSLKVTKNTKSPYVIFRGHTKENFHLVAPSPWPLLTANSVFALVVGITGFFHGYLNSVFFVFLGLFLVISNMGLWFRDIIREATFEGNHTSRIQIGLRMGMVLIHSLRNYVFFCLFLGFFSFKYRTCNSNWSCLATKSY